MNTNLSNQLLNIVNKEVNNFISKISNSSRIALRDKEGFVLAILNIEDIWQPDLELEAQSVFGTKDSEHPGSHYLLKTSKKNYIGGKIEKIVNPHHYDYKNLRHTPEELKNIFKNKKWDKVIAFQTRNPLHKAHFELTMRAMEDLSANLLVHPVVGMTKPGDVNHYTRTRCYKHIMREYPESSAFLSLLPLAMRMGGPKETLLHAIIRKNYGCTHLIVGRDHAGVGDYYGPFDAHNIFDEIDTGLITKPLKIDWTFWCNKCAGMSSMKTCPHTHEDRLLLSGSKLRHLLSENEEVPENFSRPEVLEILKNYYSGIKDSEKVKVELKGHSAK